MAKNVCNGTVLSLNNQNPVVDIEKVSIPRFGQRVRMAIDCNHLTDYKERAAFVRECVARYELVLPRPTELQYTEIAKVILAKYPCLKDRGTEYWVISNLLVLYTL